MTSAVFALIVPWSRARADALKRRAPFRRRYASSLRPSYTEARSKGLILTGLVVKNVTETGCEGPRRDRSGEYNLIFVALGVLTMIITTIRLVFKRFFSQLKALGLDDWTVLASLTICLAGIVISVEGLTPAGLGKDIWTLSISNITRFAIYFYAMEILYIAGVSLIKLTLTFFYLSIFPGSLIRRLLWWTAFFNVLYGAIFVFIAIFQCSPVSHYWEQYVDESRGRCININLFGWLHAGVGVALDIWMIAIPLCQVFKLKLHWKKKLGVCIMFVLGTL